MTTQEIIGIIIGILGPLGAFVSGIMLARATAHKTHSEARAVGSAAQSDEDKNEIASLRAIIEALEASYKTLSGQSAADLDAMRKRLAESDSDWQDLNARLEKIEGERAALFENSRRLQDELIAARSEVKRLTQRVVELENERAADRAEIARKNAELDKKNQQIADYQRRLEVAITELDHARNEGRGL